jgi:hypothetical protein
MTGISRNVFLAAGTPQRLSGANPQRRSFLIQNQTAGTVVFISYGQAVDVVIALAYGDSFEINALNIYYGAIWANCAAIAVLGVTDVSAPYVTDLVQA